MRTIAQVLAAMDQQDLFLGVKIDSVFAERFSGETALHVYAKWGDVEAIRILLENGADIDKAGEDQNTSLHYAAMLGQLDAVRCLVELGAQNLKDRYGNTARELAKKSDPVEQFLAENGF